MTEKDIPIFIEGVDYKILEVELGSLCSNDKNINFVAYSVKWLTKKMFRECSNSVETFYEYKVKPLSFYLPIETHFFKDSVINFNRGRTMVGVREFKNNPYQKFKALLSLYDTNIVSKKLRDFVIKLLVAIVEKKQIDVALYCCKGLVGIALNIANVGNCNILEVMDDMYDQCNDGISSSESGNDSDSDDEWSEFEIHFKIKKSIKTGTPNFCVLNPLQKTIDKGVAEGKHPWDVAIEKIFPCIITEL